MESNSFDIIELIFDISEEFANSPNNYEFESR